MRPRVSALALAIVLAACGGAGGVANTPPAAVVTTTTASPSVTVPPSSDVIVDSGVTEAEVSELESVLDEIETFVADTEQLLDEPLP